MKLNSSQNFIKIILVIFLSSCVFIPIVNGEEKPSEILNGVKIFTSWGNSGIFFRNFKFVLTPENILLPNDPKVVSSLGLERNAYNYRDEILDEQSENFKIYGQFEIFIPAKKFPLVNYKSGYIIVRMAQTLVDNKYSNHSKDPKRYEYVKEKQELYARIQEMVKNKHGEVEVVLEFPHHNSKEIERNIFFRTARGRYIDYVGQLRN